MRRTSIGYVFQDFNLIPALTAAENVALPRELDGERSGPPAKAARAALAEVGIEDLADRFPDEMSGGQQQRVAIARAIVGDRRLILADEPTGALDTDTGEEILRLLRARCDAGAAGVLVTHEARHAAWADRVVFLRDGVVVDETGADRGRDPRVAGSGSEPLAGWRPALRLARRDALAQPGPQHPGAGDDRAAGAGRQRRRRGLPDPRRRAASSRSTGGSARPTRGSPSRPSAGRCSRASTDRPGPRAPGRSRTTPMRDASRRSRPTLGRDVPAAEIREGGVRVDTDARRGRRRGDRARPARHPLADGLFELTWRPLAGVAGRGGRQPPPWPRRASASGPS